MHAPRELLHAAPQLLKSTVRDRRAVRLVRSAALAAQCAMAAELLTQLVPDQGYRSQAADVLLHVHPGRTLTAPWRVSLTHRESPVSGCAHTSSPSSFACSEPWYAGSCSVHCCIEPPQWRCQSVSHPALGHAQCVAAAPTGWWCTLQAHPRTRARRGARRASLKPSLARTSLISPVGPPGAVEYGG